MGSCPYCGKHVVYATLEDHEDGKGFKCPHCGGSIGLTVDGQVVE